MTIKHFPVTNTNIVEAHYSKKDNVPVTYVCTTDFKMSDRPVDIFYRETPHPEFNNRYFGIAVNYEDGSYIIFNADAVEDFSFGMVQDDEGNLQYSKSRHDYKIFNNGNMIDGGRDYIRSSLNSKIYVVRNGKMVQSDLTNADSLV
jgi:hypothetical protein